MPTLSTTNNTQSKSITPEKIRRSEHLCPENRVASEKVSTSKKDLPITNKEVKSILCINFNASAKEKVKEGNSIAFLADLHITKFVTYCELLFEVQGLSKPTQAVQIPLIRIVDKA